MSNYVECVVHEFEIKIECFLQVEYMLLNE